MAYSLYYMNGLSRQVTCIETIDAENDQEAIQVASAKQWDGLLELWDRYRFVAQFDPHDTPWAA